jgi:ATP-binding cassette subfamily C (CFTR/MRP) protein 1
MDEATANIDPKTEEVIQEAFKTSFRNTTIITIAHRIKTILDYDKILVLQDGNILEYDSPTNLIENKQSAFSALLSKSSI